MNDELKQLMPDAEELKRLIEDAANLLDIAGEPCVVDGEVRMVSGFDPERGDLMKVAMAAELVIDFDAGHLHHESTDGKWDSLDFTKGDHQSLALAVLRAASAVLKARNGNAE